MAQNPLRLALLAPLLTLVPALAAQVPAEEPPEERWQVPNHADDSVREVVGYWKATSANTVSVTVSEDGTTFAPPTSKEMADKVETNADFSEPKTWVEPGGTVGVIIIPVTKMISVVTAFLIAAFVAVVAGAIGYSIGRAKR